MLRAFFIALAVAFALGTPAHAVDPTCEDCDLFRKGVHREVIPTSDVVCVPFMQEKRGNVLLRLQLKDGTSRPYSKKNADKVGCIFVGRSWLVKAKAGSFICNDENNADYSDADLADMSRMGRLPKKVSADRREHEACLLGKQECGKRGYMTR